MLFSFHNFATPFFCFSSFFFSSCYRRLPTPPCFIQQSAPARDPRQSTAMIAGQKSRGEGGDEQENETDIAERLLKPSGFSPRRKQLQSVQDSRTSSHSYSAALCGLLFLRKRNMQKKNLFSSNIVVLGAAYLKDWPEIYPVVAHAQHISPFCNFLGNLCRNLNHIVLLFCGTLYTSATWFWF